MTKKQQVHTQTHTAKWMVLIKNMCSCNKRNGKHTNMVHGYLQDKQTDEKNSVCFEKREKNTHTHAHTYNVFITQIMNEAVHWANAKERTTKNTYTHTLRADQSRAEQRKAYKSLNN